MNRQGDAWLCSYGTLVYKSGICDYKVLNGEELAVEENDRRNVVLSQNWATKGAAGPGRVC